MPEYRTQPDESSDTATLNDLVSACLRVMDYVHRARLSSPESRENYGARLPIPTMPIAHSDLVAITIPKRVESLMGSPTH